MNAPAAAHETLSRWATTAPAFRWVPGMHEIAAGAICVRVHEDGSPWLWCVDDNVTEHEGEEAFPDLYNRATQGCVLGLIADALGVSMRAASLGVSQVMLRGLHYPEALATALHEAP